MIRRYAYLSMGRTMETNQLDLAQLRQFSEPQIARWFARCAAEASTGDAPAAITREALIDLYCQDKDMPRPAAVGRLMGVLMEAS